MGRLFSTALVIVATLAVVNYYNNNNSLPQDQNRRALRLGTLESKGDVLRRRRRETQELLQTQNETITKTLSVTAHSYCDGNDLVEYPLPKYDACPPNSTLNIIPFFGGMTNAMKFVLLGALMSFQEDRCFIVSEEQSHLSKANPNDENENYDESIKETFTSHYFEGIGLPHDHPFVVEALKEGRYRERIWKEYWENRVLRRVEGANYNYRTSFWSHPDTVDGVSLKRRFLRHLWHLRPQYRETTCQALKEKDIFDTDYIGLSIRRGDKTKEHFKFPSMDEYIQAAEPLIPSVFTQGQTPKLFVATDDCSVISILRSARPNWIFVSQCDQLAQQQMGYDINEIPTLDETQKEEHFRKFFIELYALALSKVYIGVGYTNVAWFAYMMKPNVDKSTFILLDSTSQRLMADPLSQW
eukprot:CAMPEP_0194200370 /NCGR_PEP_ID=MMETSP0156-20130528/1002_1 /TAXON_ID=33649 /ORGANISM="Thalassionema nitzschioides, Strain L26-B" /LENGTH=412 /DNA_ID=CAMNT_0038925355 /DNA_START=24 /DNA_END=1262 /DNA_ORIENTATION=-